MSSREEEERDRLEYIERSKGVSDGPMGPFQHSSYARGDGAGWHPAMITSGVGRLKKRTRRVRLEVVVGIGFGVAFLIALWIGLSLR